MKLTAKIEGKTVEIEVGNLLPNFCNYICMWLSEDKKNYCDEFKTELEFLQRANACLRCKKCIKIFGGVE